MVLQGREIRVKDFGTAAGIEEWWKRVVGVDKDAVLPSLRYHEIGAMVFDAVVVCIAI